MGASSIKFVSDNVIVECGRDSDCKIVSWQGYDYLNTDLSEMITPEVSGAQVIWEHLQVRYQEIRFSYPEIQRDFYLHFFRIESTGRITVYYDDGTGKYIDYIVSAINPDSVKVCDTPSITITFRSSMPLWKDIDEFGHDLNEKTPLMYCGMPMFRQGYEYLTYKMTGIMVAAYSTYNGLYAFENDGEYPIGFRLEMRTTDQTVNPKIYLEDNPDIFIEVYCTLNIGDTLIVSTVIENGNTPDTGEDIYVTLNGENYLNKCNLESTFFQMPVGINTIAFSAESGESNLQLYLYRNFVFSWA